ncbi:Fanconi anemia group B protein [Pleurodeles waltl]
MMNSGRLHVETTINMRPDGEQDHLLSYNGQILVFQLSRSKAAESSGYNAMATLRVKRMAFDPGTGQFSQKGSGQYGFKGGDVQIICCSSAVDSRTWMVLPCVLIRKRQKRSTDTKYLLLLLHTPDDFECCLKFQLDYEIVDDVLLCDGPTVLWRRESTLSHISLQTQTVMNALVEFPSVKWSGAYVDEGLVIVGVKNVHLPVDRDGPSLSVSDGVLWGSEFIGYALEKQKLVTTTCLLPNGYSCVVVCMHVFLTEDNDGRPRTNVAAATSKKQLLWFQDGVPMDTCQLPFEEPSRIQLASTGNGDMLFVVFFNPSEACAVWKDSFQVAASWQGVRSVQVDDFVGAGREQILVLFKDSSCSTNLLSAFKITDFGEVNYESGLPVSEGEAATDEGLEIRFRTLQALETRLQAAMASVQELQQHLELKERVLMESCAALMDLSRGREHLLPSALEEGLVSLWDDQEPSRAPSAGVKEVPQQDPGHLVERVWQRVVEDHWVVGVKLVDSADSSLSDVSLSLLMERGFHPVSPVTVCHSDVLKLTKLPSTLPVSARQMEPLAKRVKLGHQSSEALTRHSTARLPSEAPSDWARTVTTVTELSPLLALRNVTCLVLLHARKARHQDGCSESQERLTLPCGRISVRLEDVVSGKHSATLSQDHRTAANISEDLFAFLAIFHKFTFKIHSPACTLSPLNTWLLRNMKCQLIKHYTDYMLYKGTGNSEHVLLKWMLEGPCEGILSVFCRNQSILFQFLHVLIGMLPPSCLVKQLILGTKEDHGNNLAQSLEEEMLTHRRSLTTAINIVEKEFTATSSAEKRSSSFTTSLPKTADAVQQCRDELQSDQKQSRAGEHLVLSGDLYRETVLKMAQVQLNTDLLAQKQSCL